MGKTTLTYSDEMREQDALQAESREDPVVMKRLHESIVAEAKEKGFTGLAVTIDYVDEIITEVYDTFEEYKWFYLQSGDEIESKAAACFLLIEHLERAINDPDLEKHSLELVATSKAMLAQECPGLRMPPAVDASIWAETQLLERYLKVDLPDGSILLTYQGGHGLVVERFSPHPPDQDAEHQTVARIEYDPKRKNHKNGPVVVRRVNGDNRECRHGPAERSTGE